MATGTEPAADRHELFAAWRLPANAHEPVSIDYGNGKLAVPTATRPTAP